MSVSDKCLTTQRRALARTKNLRHYIRQLIVSEYLYNIKDTTYKDIYWPMTLKCAQKMCLGDTRMHTASGVDQDDSHRFSQSSHG